MSGVAIRVDGLGKRYRIGRAGAPYRTLRETLAGLASYPFRRKRGRDAAADRRDRTIWALRDVTFSVAAGESVAVIGRNGAGKSTLLKVLSRITEPTVGTGVIRGRVGALLEVGTAFHPELTGRENVLLSGAILGMRRAEILRKFDEMVAFAEVEQFIDTPVKHYSSGMHMRLGFAVAAHLDPDILVVDEVLAVGDAAFQRKSQGKMNEVAREGRTLVFVSHDLAAVRHLCRRAILLERGSIVADGPTDEVVDAYLATISSLAEGPVSERRDRDGRGDVVVSGVEVLDPAGRPVEMPMTGQEVVFRVHVRCKGPGTYRGGQVTVLVQEGEQVLFLLSTAVSGTRELVFEGEGHVDFVVPELPLPGGEYLLSPVVQARGEFQDSVVAARKLLVVDGDFFGTGRVRPTRKWKHVGALVRHHYRLDPHTERRSPPRAG